MKPSDEIIKESYTKISIGRKSLRIVAFPEKVIEAILNYLDRQEEKKNDPKQPRE